MTAVRRLGSFGASTILSGGVSFLSIPLIVMFTDPQAWGAIALGQAVGSSVGVLAMFGWGITGPSLIAMMDPARHAAAYFDSVAARLLLAPPAVALAMLVTGFLVPGDRVAAMMCAVAMAFGGLSGSWYLVGRNRPDRLLLLDTVPRVAGTLLGIGGLWLNSSLVLFGALQLLGSLAAFGLVTVWALPGLRRPEGASRGLRGTLAVVAQQRHGVLVAVSIASYYPIVLAIVARLVPGSLPLYALLEKVLRFAGMVMQPVFQYLQATVPAASDLKVAIRRSLLAVLGVAVLCSAGFALLLPVAGKVLTAGQVPIPWLVSVNMGGYMGGVVIMTYLSSVALVAVGRVNAASTGTIIGAVVGLAVTAVCAWTGVTVSWGFLVTAALVIAYELYVLVVALRGRDAEPAVADELQPPLATPAAADAAPPVPPPLPETT